MLHLFFLGTSIVFFSLTAHSQTKLRTAILVDKKTNQIYLTNAENGEYRLIKTYRTTVGKVKGDKEDEGDLKTPEGIYTILSKHLPPSIQPKLGDMAFMLNFPNAYDRLAGRSGSGIMLHATNEPDRLNKDYDSEGCIVVKNEEIAEIAPKIRLGLTPVLIFAELTPEYWKPGQNTTLKNFFKSWIQAWESRSIDTYIRHYHSDFSAQGMDKDGWKRYKESLNQRYGKISIGPEDVLYYTHPKYSVITFTQNYRSVLKNGKPGHASRGTKILYIAQESGEPKIISETYSPRMW
jgi:murein L,D-transpeptidase YafK